MLKVKGTVRPYSLIIAAAAINASIELKLVPEVYITSGNDSAHMVGSKHYTGEALDFRTKTLAPQELQAWIANIRRRLGPNYQVIKEIDHLHIERDA